MAIVKTINFFSKDMPPVVQVAQGTSALTVIFKSADLQIDAEATARIYVKKPSGLEVYNACTVIDTGAIVANITTQMCAEVGTAECQLNITQENTDVANSAVFYLEVMKTIIDGSAIESTSEYGALQELINDATEAISECEDAAAIALGATANYFVTATYSKSGTVHLLTLAADYSTAMMIRFIPTAAWADGDTLQIKRGSASAVTVGAYTVEGDALPAGAWAANASVICTFNGTNAYFPYSKAENPEPRSSTTHTLQGTSTVKLDKVGSCVHAYFTLPGAWSAGKTALTNPIPAAYRPAAAVYSGFHRALSGDSLSNNGCQISIGTDGAVVVRSTDAVANTWTYYISLSWDVPEE